MFYKLHVWTKMLIFAEISFGLTKQILQSLPIMTIIKFERNRTMIVTQSTLSQHSMGRLHYAGNCFASGWMEKPRFHHHIVNLYGYIKAETEGSEKVKTCLQMYFRNGQWRTHISKVVAQFPELQKCQSCVGLHKALISI